MSAIHDSSRSTQRWYTLRVLAGAPPAPFLVSFDVSRAFDCVDVTCLLDLVEPLLRQRDYLLVKYVEVRAAAGTGDQRSRNRLVQCDGHVSG